MVLCAIATSACGDSKDNNKDAPAASNTGKSASTASTAAEEKPPVDKGKDGKENVELAQAYAKEACECKTAQCINKAGENYQKASDKMYADRQIRTPTPEQKKLMDEASARVSECTDKLLKNK
jgi:hypothetical protein